jgi:8-oxo-dGTP pyrophosphatase MutT (NUDIX family)
MAKKDLAFGIIPILPTSPRRYLLILHNKGHWAFPKGHKDGQETDLEAACRELEEETGLKDYEIIGDTRFSEHYQFWDPKGERIEKTVVYYLAWVKLLPNQEIPTVIPQASEIADYCWCTVNEGMNRLSFEAGRQLLRECEDFLKNHSC